MIAWSMTSRRRLALVVFHIAAVTRCATILSTPRRHHCSSLVSKSLSCRSLWPLSVNIRRRAVTNGFLTALSLPHVPTFDELEQCWNCDSWSVNPLNASRIDKIMQCLNSPAPQSFFVINRAIRMAKQRDDPILHTMQGFGYLLKPGCQLTIARSLQQAGKENVSWDVLPMEEVIHDGWLAIPRMVNIEGRTVLEMASETLSVVMDASDKQQSADESFLCSRSKEALDRLWWTLGTDVRGRSAADAAFSFAMAGSRSKELFTTLSHVTQLELARVGTRSSFRPKFVLQIVEKLASAGVKDDDVRGVHKAAARCLALKNQHQEAATILSQDVNRFDLHSPRSLIWLWRFSSRLSKAKELEENESKPSNSHIIAQSCDMHNRCWWEAFEDPSLPLVIDIGCGFGLSLLGLASLSMIEQSEFDQSPEAQSLGNLHFGRCNYLGVDLNALGIGYAKGVAERWQLGGRLQFTRLAAEKLLEQVTLYHPEQVALVLIQFPTPFRFQDKATGNAQLPSFCDNGSNGFMASKSLLERVATLLQLSEGRLVIQSNVEDVAVVMRDMLINQIGMEAVTAPNPMLHADESAELPLRTQQWLQQGRKRAVGTDWSSKSYLPTRAATETEAACSLHGTPIHRCMFHAASSIENVKLEQKSEVNA